MQRLEKPKPLVLTIGMLGTGEHRANEKMVVDEFIRAVADDPNQISYLIDGPGGAPPKTEKKHPMLGNYDPRVEVVRELSGKLIIRTDKIPTESNSKELLSEPSTIKTVNLKASKTRKSSGLISGSGYREAIVEVQRIMDAILVADEDVRNGQRPLIINLAGFSRGADTLLRITNTLAARYPDINLEVNIFSIDPVPGPRRRAAKKATVVPNIVKHMIVTSMQDERRPLFDPQDVTKLSQQDPEHTILEQRIYRGTHGHAKRFWAKPNSNKKENATADEVHLKTLDGAKLLWHDLHRFARTTGTKLDGAIPYVWRDSVRDNDGYIDHVMRHTNKERNLEDRLQFYNKMVLNAQFYEKASGRGSRRKFVDHKEDYFLHGRQFFQDREHMTLFKQVYPALFDYYFQRNISGYSNQAVINDVKKMQENEPYLTDLLPKAGLPWLSGSVTEKDLGLPAGISLQAEYFYWNKELLQLHETHPQFFNYFLQKAANPVDRDLLEQELQNIQLNPDLAEFLRTVVPYDVMSMRIEMLPYLPHGRRDVLQELKTNKEIMRLWTGAQAICQAAIAGHDSSISATEARGLLNILRLYLDKTPGSEATLLEMNKAIKDKIEETKKPGLFIYKLNSILETPVPSIQLVNHCIAKLNSYKLSKEDPVRQALIENTLAALIQLREESLGNDTRAIASILATATQVSGWLLREQQEQHETKLDKMLRELAREIPNYSANGNKAAMDIAENLRGKYFIKHENGGRSINPKIVAQAKMPSSTTAKRKSSDSKSRKISLRWNGMFSSSKTPSTRKNSHRKEEPENEKEQAKTFWVRTTPKNT